MRAFVLVLDSFGIGGAPDAALYGDAGADTLGHIAAVCARGEAPWTSARATDSLLLVAGCMLANQSTPRPFSGRSRAGRGRID